MRPTTRVPFSGAETIASSPPMAASRSHMLANPTPADTARSSKPAPSSRTWKRRTPLSEISNHRDGRARGVLDHILDGLEAAEVGRALDLARVAPADPGREHGDGQRGTPGGGSEPFDETEISERRRVDAAGKRTDLVKRVVELGAELADELGAAAVGGVHLLRRQLDLDTEGNEPLLCAVVQVALDPPAFLVSGGLDPGTGFADLGQQGCRFGTEPVIVARYHEVGRGSCAVRHRRSWARAPAGPTAARRRYGACRTSTVEEGVLPAKGGCARYRFRVSNGKPTHGPWRS